MRQPYCEQHMLLSRSVATWCVLNRLLRSLVNKCQHIGKPGKTPGVPLEGVSYSEPTHDNRDWLVHCTGLNHLSRDVASAKLRAMVAGTHLAKQQLARS